MELAHHTLIKPALITMAKLLIAFLWFEHLIACAFWYLAYYHAPTRLDFPYDSIWRLVPELAGADDIWPQCACSPPKVPPVVYNHSVLPSAAL